MSSSVTIRIGNVSINIFLRRCQEVWGEEALRREEDPIIDVPYTYWEESSGVLKDIFKRVQEQLGVDRAQIIRDGVPILGGAGDIQTGDVVRLRASHILTLPGGEQLGVFEWGDGQVEVFSPDPDFARGPGRHVLAKIEDDILQAARAETAKDQIEEMLRNHVQKHGGTIRQVVEAEEDEDHNWYGRMRIEL